MPWPGGATGISTPCRPAITPEETAEGRGVDLKMFFTWAAERDVTRAGQVTRPILEAYQKWLWRHEKSAERQRLG